MRIFGLNKRKTEKNYLRIYANMGKGQYSEKDKEKISNRFIKIANDLNGFSKFKYDISGPGYGISKGSPYLGEKAFVGRIKNKGYSKLTGINIMSKENSYNSRFILMKWPNDMNWLDVCFSWPHLDDENLDVSIKILENFSEIIQINYAYAYPTHSDLYDLGERIMSKNIFSFSTKTSKPENLWKENIKNIKLGFIKKLYPVNVFNKSQRENLNGILPLEKIKLNNDNEVWKFESNSLKHLKPKITSAILN